MTRRIPIIRCSRCRRRLRKPGTASEDGWNAVLDMGIVTAVLCPDCQTPEEHAEAANNDATTEYVGMTVDGRMVGRAKTGEQ